MVHAPIFTTRALKSKEMEVLFMKFMKSLKEYVEGLPPEEFCLYSNEPGSKNMLIVVSEQFKLSKAWITDEFSPVPAAVIAHGFNDNGEIMICSKDIPKMVIGMGKKAGFALYIQYLEHVFYIAICNDTKGKHERFFLTATSDKNIVGIILTIIEQFCPSLEDLEHITSFIQNEVNS